MAIMSNETDNFGPRMGLFMLILCIIITWLVHTKEKNNPNYEKSFMIGDSLKIVKTFDKATHTLQKTDTIIIQSQESNSMRMYQYPGGGVGLTPIDPATGTLGF